MSIEAYTNDPENPFISIIAEIIFPPWGLSEDHHQSYIAIYPIPAHDILNFQSNETIKSAHILNLAGQNIKSIIIDAEEGKISVGDLDAGFYCVEFKTENGTTVQKITVK